MIKRRKQRANADIRQIIKHSPVFTYEVAEAMNMQAATFSMWLQHELDDGDKQRIKATVEKLSKVVVMNE